jgi:hypothetical protein
VSSLRSVLAIAEVADQDGSLRGADRSAPFDCPKERAQVIRGELLGYLEVTRSERHCLWARLTAKGSQELHHMRGEEA